MAGAMMMRPLSPRSRRRSLRVAAVCSGFLGFGLGVPCVYGIWHLARTGEIATFLGYPTYGKGRFDRAGIPTTVPLLAAFLGVCLADVAAGWLLWNGRRAGTLLAIGLLPLDAVFWIGFDLPYPPPIGVARTAAVLVVVAGARGHESDR